MTWQRIDENTYIDDTLVTCAEYQLFIDEMREQGKYYQPDHWTSYQFPEGQAKEPILGLRHSDAIAFCEWLTLYQGAGWKYRLPTQQDVYVFPIKPMSIIPLGFWLNNQMLFTWVGAAEKDVNWIIKNLDQARGLAHDIADIGYALYALDFPHPLDHDLLNDYNNAQALVGILDHKIARIVQRDNKQDISEAVNLAMELNNKFPFRIDRALRLAREVKWDSHPDIIRARALKKNITLDLSDVIFTLQERIAGRSPAFEGIRLVKERIK